MPPSKTKFGRGIYPNYFFKGDDHDPIIDYVRSKMVQTHTSPQQLVQSNACSSSTASNWGLTGRDVKVKRPSFATVASVLRTMGVDQISLNALVGSSARPRLKAIAGGRR
jgi:hypothetical protein